MLSNALSGQPILKGVGAATVGGAVAGGLAGLTLGGSLVVSAVGGGLAATAGGGVHRAVESGGDPKMSAENMSIDFAAGATLGVVAELLSSVPPAETLVPGQRRLTK